MTNEHLKACPFCGGEVQLETDIVGSGVECYECQIGHTCHNWTQEAAIQIWNNRAKDEENAKLREALRAIYRKGYLQGNGWHGFAKIAKAALQENER